MIPRTVHNLATFECLSALQKCIRRGMEREAMEFAVEIAGVSKAFASMVANRLEIISHEDIGLAAPEIIPLVRICCDQARQWYDPQKPGRWRMPIGTAIRAMCRAKKSREGDHFHAAIGGRSDVEGYAPVIPDWAFDQHTHKGRKLGRGLEYFRTESTRLVPAPEKPDPYEEEAFRMWAAKKAAKPAGGKGRKKGPAQNAAPQGVQAAKGPVRCQVCGQMIQRGQPMREHSRYRKGSKFNRRWCHVECPGAKPAAESEAGQKELFE